jgi:hypothetical protein
MRSDLAEKLMSICAPNAPLENNHSLDNIFGIDNLTEEQRIQVEAELIKHFEFERIAWMTLPTGLSEDKTTPTVVDSTKISDTNNPKYSGKVGYVYKVLFTPKIYEPGEIYKPVKDGCVFAPIMYDPNTFQPTQSITLTWSPEFPQDIDAPERTYEEDKQVVRDMLEKVLNSPEEYRPEGYRGCIVRFATI